MKKGGNRSLDESIIRFNKEICSGTLLFGIIISLFLFFAGNLSISRGFLLGTCFSIINFILLTFSLPFSWGKNGKQATGIYSVSIVTRFMILAIPIIIAIKSSKFDLVSTIVGIFSIQIFLFVYHTIIPRIEKRLFLSGE